MPREYQGSGEGTEDLLSDSAGKAGFGYSETWLQRAEEERRGEERDLRGAGARRDHGAGSAREAEFIRTAVIWRSGRRTRLWIRVIGSKDRSNRKRKKYEKGV